jgi:hypothetical protein
LSAQAAWTFETDGELDTIQPLGIKVPNGVPTDVAVINSTSGSWELNPRSDLATTGGSGSGLTVNVTETGGYASTIAIAEIAGTGYLNGDVITVTSGTSNATFTIVIGGRNTWQFGTDRALTLPSGTSNIQSVQQNGYQSKITVSPFRILSQARRSQTQSYSATNEDFTSAASDGNGMIAFVGLQGGVAEFIIDTMDNGGVYERTVRLNGTGPEYGYNSFNDTDDQVFLNIAAPAGAVTEIRFSYTRISKIDIEPDEGVFRIESEPSQDIDIQSGNELRAIATDRVDITTGTNMRLRAGDGSVQISTNFQVPGATTYEWTFGTGGTLTFPDSTTQNTAARITIVGDDSTGTTLNAGETIKIAGTQNITTAVSGDTLTITGPNLSSYLTSVPSTIEINEISSADSTAIQINDAVNVSGAGTFHGSVRFNAGYTEKINALTSSSTITVNCATASIHTVTLAVSTGFVISNLPTGGTVTLIITQGGSGSYTATFGTDGSTTVKFPGGVPTLSTAVGAIDVVTVFNDGTNYLGNIAKAYAA